MEEERMLFSSARDSILEYSSARGKMINKLQKENALFFQRDEQIALF
jgi:hypothetical protein